MGTNAMSQLAIALVLILASTNASKYLQSLNEFQQEPIPKRLPDYPADLMVPYLEDRIQILPALTYDVNQMDTWPSDSNPFAFRQTLSHGMDDARKKRTDNNLSIVNALDVLRQNMLMELARRKSESRAQQIEKNRELLMKTGKRSYNSYEEPANYGLREFLVRKRQQSDDYGKGVEAISSSKSNRDRNPTTRTYQNEYAYHT